MNASPYVSATDLLQFAFSATTGGTIEFLFSTVGGSSGVFSPSAPLDVQITVGSTLAPQFTTSWFNSQETAALGQPTSTVSASEPATAWLLGMGSLAWVVSRRKRERR